MTDTALTLPRGDAVNHPRHYQGRGGVEAIDVIESVAGLEGHASNAIKYILRHAAKGRPKEDLEKARWYVRRLLRNTPRIAKRHVSTLMCERALRGFDSLIVDEQATDAGEAFMCVAYAINARAEDRYRAYLRQAEAALTRAIEQVERPL